MRGGAVEESSRRLPLAVGRAIFGSDAAGYQSARLGYPPELYAPIAVRGNGAVRSILEIGPGTGLATSDLLARLDPERLLAVEVDPVLAAHLAETVPYPRLETCQAGFLDAEIAGQFDLACCAAAFHWLDPEPAFRRLRQLLKPGATLALWRNVYRQTGIGDLFADAVTKLLTDIVLPPSEGSLGHYSLDVEFHRTAVEGAGFEAIASHIYRRERVLTTQEVRALYASYSYVRALDDAERERLLDSIASLADRRFTGQVPNVTMTALYLAAATS